ncbi:reverse transcriptase family protein [Pseudomonas sp. SW-3]|uniref:reverse transcriptase family protein n=1 Tax=Pseudomonas sp. SW-3 TaxID=147212 RepID=UPI001909207A|nr:reverse transcriptase family protein [Pseudomonas sp. SW-3]QQN98437.1 RNA-directed DNA polymerase [Pseudomonas sp. SW-3]
MDNIESQIEVSGLMALYRDLNLSVEDLAIVSRMIARTDLFYRSFRIPKRRGGTRLISSPYPTLDKIQKSILQNVLEDYLPHDSAYAYVKNKCAVGHARYHLGSREILQLDIKEYFPSISRQMIFGALSRNGCDPKKASYISILCTLKNALPQGACTSPMLSNLVFFPIDVRFSKLASSLRLRYSRYADDIVFSGGKVPRDLPGLVRKILLDHHFCLNEDKTQFKIFGAKKIITGVSISSGVLKAPKAFKRNLRAQIHELERNKFHLSSQKEFDPLVFERILGRVNYLLQIEPDNIFALQKKKVLSFHHQEFLGLIDDFCLDI